MTPSTCALLSQSAPVLRGRGLPKAICMPGNFSSWSMLYINSVRPVFVPIANSPTLLLFSSVSKRYLENSCRSCSLSHWTLSFMARPSATSMIIGVCSREPYLSAKKSPIQPSITTVPLTLSGDVHTSPSGRFFQWP